LSKLPPPTPDPITGGEIVGSTLGWFLRGVAKEQINGGSGTPAPAPADRCLVRYVSLATSPQAGSYRWAPGTGSFWGFLVLNTGVQVCISLDGTLAADTVAAGSIKDGLIYKGASPATITTPHIFPRPIKFRPQDTIFVSKNQAAEVIFLLYYTLD
jgi:hypothetical protein